MQVITKQQYNYIHDALLRNTYQSPFPPNVPCVKCGGEKTRAILLVNDDEGAIAEQRPVDVEVWPHDCVVFVIYFCVECGQAMVEWNQA